MEHLLTDLEYRLLKDKIKKLHEKNRKLKKKIKKLNYEIRMRKETEESLVESLEEFTPEDCPHTSTFGHKKH